MVEKTKALRKAYLTHNEHAPFLEVLDSNMFADGILKIGYRLTSDKTKDLYLKIYSDYIKHTTDYDFKKV